MPNLKSKTSKLNTDGEYEIEAFDETGALVGFQSLSKLSAGAGAISTGYESQLISTSYSGMIDPPDNHDFKVLIINDSCTITGINLPTFSNIGIRNFKLFV